MSGIESKVTTSFQGKYEKYTGLDYTASKSPFLYLNYFFNMIFTVYFF